MATEQPQPADQLQPMEQPQPPSQPQPTEQPLPTAQPQAAAPRVDELDPNDFSELEGSERTTSDTTLPPPAAKIPASSPSLRVESSGRRLRKRAIGLTVSVATAIAAGSLFYTGKGQATLQPPRREETAVTAPVPQALIDAPETAKPALPPRAAADTAETRPAVPEKQPPAANTERRAVDARKAKAEAEFWKARAAGILVDTGLPAAPSRPPAQHDNDDDSDMETQLPQRAATQMVVAPAGGDIFGNDPNLQGRKNQFMAGESRSRAHRLKHIRTPYALTPGTVIRAALQSAMNSDLPGKVIARVVENVCDSVTGDWLLIPQGTVVLANYDSMVAWGQERVLLCWNELWLPNSDSMPLGCMPAADWAGRAGMNDLVDEHWWRIVKGAAVSSLLTAGTAAAAGNTTGFSPTLPQLTARGAASEIGNAGQAITRRNIMIQPTLEIRQAQPVNIIVTELLDFSPDGPATPCHSR